MRCSEEGQGRGVCALRRLEKNQQPKPSPSMAAAARNIASSIPRTSEARLSQPDAFVTPFPAKPIPSTLDLSSPTAPATVLYLAYGSNLCAETFLGMRGIRPVSQVNVSAPSLRLTFDLAGLPYREPCFANTAPRKIPKPPVPIPIDPPDVPDIPDIPDHPPIKPPHWQSIVGELDVGSGHGIVERNAAGDPVWNKGLIGVVYEVTTEDYTKIIATEGGGVSYHDVMVPCLIIPPAIRVPERPPIPELPKPFLAHTLYAPRLPDIPDKSGARDGDDDDKIPKPEVPSWAKRLLLPVQRPDPDYAQASARYLRLITDGAREHELPTDYQAYLNALQPYTITSWRQQLGQVLFLGFWMPAFLMLTIVSRILSDDKGRVPTWLATMLTVLFNLVWMSYDVVAKPLFGDGERTQEEEDEQVALAKRIWCSVRWRRKTAGPAPDEEKRCLIPRNEKH